MKTSGWIQFFRAPARPRPVRPAGRIRTLLLAGLTGVAGIGAENGAPVPVLKFAKALPAVKLLAEREGIAFDGIDSTADRNDLLPGDSITLLVSLTQGEEISQWLVQATCAELNEKERQRPVEKDVHLFSSTGTEIVFRHTQAALNLRVLGPCRQGKGAGEPGPLNSALKPVAEVNARITVNSEFLGFGFDRACESVLVVREAMKNQPELRSFKWDIGQKPYPSAVITQTQAKAKSAGLTPERERAFAGAIPALREFWRLASRTPGLQEIVRSVADLPWWSIIVKGGEVKVKLKPKFAAAHPVKLVGNTGGHASGYGFPFEVEVNGKVALSCHLLAVAAQPPLLTSAGIIGLAAQSPDGKGPHLMVQVSAAHLQKQAGNTPVKSNAAVRAASQ